MKKTKEMPKTQEYTQKIAKRLEIGDRVVSATGKILTVSLVVNKTNRTIVLFDGDMEIDFDPYFNIEKVLKSFK
jgi:preprotein translocase subunit YajC